MNEPIELNFAHQCFRLGERTVLKRQLENFVITLCESMLLGILI